MSSCAVVTLGRKWMSHGRKTTFDKQLTLCLKFKENFKICITDLILCNEQLKINQSCSVSRG